MAFLRRLHDLYRGDVEPDWRSDRRYILFALLLAISTGPLIFLVYSIQDWSAESRWDYEDRWKGTKAFAVTFLLTYMPIIIFRADLLLNWPRFLGDPVWYNPVLWWYLCMPLSPALALIAERVDPRTKKLERILLPFELQQKQAQAEEKASQTKTTRRKKSVAQPNEQVPIKPIARKQGKQKDPRPIYEAWAVQQTLPETPSDIPSRSSSEVSTSSGTSSKRVERDEGESLKDVF
jgi:hypothetical protein